MSGFYKRKFEECLLVHKRASLYDRKDFILYMSSYNLSNQTFLANLKISISLMNLPCN